MSFEEQVPLARFTTIGTGGPARYLATPTTEEELALAVRFAADRGLEVAAVGLGSNLLVADEGFDGLVVSLAGELAAVEIRGDLLVAGGGATNAVALHAARNAGLGGLEFACAIPGTVGGGVKMNAGAYGGDWAGTMARARVVDGDGSGWYTPEELHMTYRSSRLGPDQVVAQVEFRLTRRHPDEIKARVKELNGLRKAAQPTNRRTFGSVFKNPADDLTAGRMLEACGLKGHRLGGAQISPKHANFIENADGARSADAIALMGEARRRAREQFGVVLEHEVQFLGPLELPPVD